MKDAVVIPLPFWQDPQGDVVLVYSERECSVYFGCWTEDGEPADFVGHLAFERVSACRSFPREFLPYRVSGGGKSQILQVVDSDMVSEIRSYRKEHYPTSPSANSMHIHYVVVGHDIYHEIVAAGYAAHTILRAHIPDANVRRLIELA